MERVVYDRLRVLEEAHWWFVARRKILSRLIAALSLPHDARLLEVGCGVGGNISMLRTFGQVEALEPDAESRAYVEHRWGLAPRDGSLPNHLPFEADSFAGVFALDVVEHVDDDHAAMRALAALVAPGGYLLVTVPAYGWMWSRHDEAHHHKRRYTRAQVEGLMQAAGCSLVKSSYFNTVLFPLAAMARVLKRLLGLTGEDDRMPPAWLNGLFERLFSGEADWLARGALPFGLSIVVAGRRPV